MKSKVLIPLIIVLLLTAIAVPSNAQILPSVSGTYTISTTPPVDATYGAIIVTPGQAISIEATASGTYSGPTLNDFPVKVTTYSYLYMAGVEQASKIAEFNQKVNLATGTIPPTSGTTSIDVPADAIPGLYTLKIEALISIEYLGVKYTKSSEPEIFIVKVVPASASPGATATPTPAPTETPKASPFDVNQMTVTVGSDGTGTFKSGEVTGTTGSGTGSGMVDLNLTHVPDGHLNMYVQSDPDPAAETQFMLAAANSGSDIKDIAFVLVVEKTGLVNGADIASATITMKVSKAWVDANGGAGMIKIIRYSDGKGEALDTTCLNPGGDPMVFQALSPHGLSRFALAAIAKLPVTAAETVPQGPQISTSLIIGIAAVIIIVLVAIIGISYLLTHRKKKK